MQSPSDNTLIIVAGPTAVGKTGVAIHLAQHYGTEIISADSRQCFSEFDIVVARPSQEELRSVPHHFIASHSIHEEVNAVTFEQYALEKLADIFRFKKIAIVTGGTGLYIKALTDGLDEIPAVEPGIREHVMNAYDEKGIQWLQEELMRADTLFYATGETANPQRMMRALEVMLSTGRSILSFQNQSKKTRDFNVIMIGLDIPREQLIQNIGRRVDNMVLNGMEEEARGLIPFTHLNALQTVGYKEMFAHFDGITSFDQAIEQIKINTRQYAKRQMTWFRKAPGITWFTPRDTDKIIEHIDQRLAESSS